MEVNGRAERRELTVLTPWTSAALVTKGRGAREQKTTIRNGHALALNQRVLSGLVRPSITN